MARISTPPAVDDEFVIVQTEIKFSDGEAIEEVSRIPVRVHYVRRRGDFQVETFVGQRWWVNANGRLRDSRIDAYIRHPKPTERAELDAFWKQEAA